MKFKTASYFIFVSIVSLMSCGRGKDDIEVPEAEMIFQNTFESSSFWGSVDSRVKRGAAHSGSYVCVLDTLNPFSVTFVSAVGDISTKPLKKINGRAFVKCKNVSGSISFGAQLETKDPSGQPKTIFLADSYLEFRNLKVNEWAEVRFTAALPADVKGSDIAKVFVFNKSREEIFVDDIKVSFE